MRYSKHFAGFALAVGLALSGASALRAADWRSAYGAQQDFRADSRDLRGDYNSIGWLRRAIVDDRARLDADFRFGRRWAVERDREQLIRDQRALDSMMRETRYDRSDMRRDYGRR